MSPLSGGEWRRGLSPASLAYAPRSGWAGPVRGLSVVSSLRNGQLPSTGATAPHSQQHCCGSSCPTSCGLGLGHLPPASVACCAPHLPASPPIWPLSTLLAVRDPACAPALRAPAGQGPGSLAQSPALFHPGPTVGRVLPHPDGQWWPRPGAGQEGAIPTPPPGGRRLRPQAGPREHLAPYPGKGRASCPCVLPAGEALRPSPPSKPTAAGPTAHAAHAAPEPPPRSQPSP